MFRGELKSPSWSIRMVAGETDFNLAKAKFRL